MKNLPLILIIDDEIAISKTLQESLEDEGFRTKALNDGNMALSVIGEIVPDMVLLDIFMPKCNGLELLANIKREYPTQKVIVISGFGNIPLAVEAIKNGAVDFIEKPLNLDDILSKLAHLKNNYDTTNKKPQHDTHLIKEKLHAHEIIGESALFNELVAQINIIAKLKYPILIYGQTGTGKTIFSKYIHEMSEASSMPYTIINCSSETNIILDPQKLEGTIFFKNVDMLSDEDQKTLLRFFEDPVFQEKNLHNKIRIIASSVSYLFSLVQEQKWNRKLFHMLNITPIEIPALSKRRYDIPLLIDHFLRKANKKFNKNISLCNLSIRYLRNRLWPENVIGLKNFIYKIVEIIEDTDAQVLLAEIKPFLPEQEIEFVEEQTFLNFNSLNEATSVFQKRYLLHVIQKNNFDLEQVANKLKLDSADLNTKLVELDINLKKLH